MENWGLITYREKYLLFDPIKDSVLSKRPITAVTAHEVRYYIFRKKM